MPAGKHVITNKFLTVATVDLSDHIESAELQYSSALQPVTSMGDGTERRKGGIKDWSLTVTFRQDYDAAKVDATLFALVGADAALVMRPDTGVVATNNPQFTGTGVLESYSPIGGSVGDTHNTQVTFQANSDLARAVS